MRPDQPTQGRLQFIWACLWALALLATLSLASRALLGWLGIPGWLAIVLLGGLCAPFVLAKSFIRGVLIPHTIGIRCPACAERSLIYANCLPFGYRYYRCSECRKRFKRCDVLDPWEDASGPEDAPFFKAKPGALISKGQEWARAGVFVALLSGCLLCGVVGFWAGAERGCVIGSLLGWAGFSIGQRRIVSSSVTPFSMSWDDGPDRLA